MAKRLRFKGGTALISGGLPAVLRRCHLQNAQNYVIIIRKSPQFPLGKHHSVWIPISSCLCHLHTTTGQVRQMRSIESQLKWDMYREERSQTEEERREEVPLGLPSMGSDSLVCPYMVVPPTIQ